MKTNRLFALPVIAVSALFAATYLFSQNAPAPAAGALPPAPLSAAQQTAVTTMNTTVAPLVQAVTTARNELLAASLSQPANAANVQTKAQALGAAELALAQARAAGIAQIQAGATPLTVAQIQNLNAPAGRGGGRGGAAAGPQRKRLLIWADTRNGQAQHEFVSHAMAVIERMGRESGLYDTTIRTDSEIISYAPKNTNGGRASGGPSLANVDAIFSLVHREAPLAADQRPELLRFVHDDGKGFVTAHTGLTAFLSWPEFREMVGGGYGGHNIGWGPHPLVVEDPAFPGARLFPARSDMSEEWYTLTDYSREKIRVILRLDVSGIANPPANVAALGGDFPVAWARQYGNGRVFASTFAHDTTAWDDPKIQQLYFEAIKWALRITDIDATPRPFPKAQ